VFQQNNNVQPIQHVVVIFDENESFDHYFGMYPYAANLTGETPFTAAAGTPTLTTGLYSSAPNGVPTGPLLTANPNCYNSGTTTGPCNNTGNAVGASEPFRIDYAQAFVATQDHFYTPEQEAFDGGAMDLFPEFTGAPDDSNESATNPTPAEKSTGLAMGYFDGNTVTALWNYAQHYSLNDHFFGTTFGPSEIGAINLISGQTNGVITTGSGSQGVVVSDGSTGTNATYTVISDSDPTDDVCTYSDITTSDVSMSGNNIGDLLSAANVTWGWFQGGFNLTLTNTNNTVGCQRSSTTIVPPYHTVNDYTAYHDPFQFYPSTANYNHTRPTSIAAIGTNDDGANHNYDSNDFAAALAAGNLPSVSFLKPPAYQDSHAGYSDPVDEQTWLVTEINMIEQSKFWPNTAIIVAYDDSDGWYDHMNDVVNGSNVGTASTVVTAAHTDYPSCTGVATILPGVNSAVTQAQGRCGHGPRLPLLVISPWANKNYIDSTPVDQTSIIRFIEDVFLNGQRLGYGSYDKIAGSIDNMFNFSSSTAPNPNIVVLNPTTGVVTSGN
jgi:phospholipase C